MIARLALALVAMAAVLLPHVPGARAALGAWPGAVSGIALAAHDHGATVVAAGGVISLFFTSWRALRARRLARTFDLVASPLPATLERAFSEHLSAAEFIAVRRRIRYIDIGRALCFTPPGDDRFVVTRGFLERHGSPAAAIVVRHELAHIHHRDGFSATMWRCAFAGLLLPGSEALERLLHRRRELRATRATARRDPAAYRTAIAGSPRADSCLALPPIRRRQWLALGAGAIALTVLAVHSVLRG